MSEVPESRIEIDALGARCPIPVQRVRRALKDAPEGAVVVLVGDDPESRHDIPALLHRLGLAPPSVTESSGTFTFVIVNTAPPE